MADAAGMGAGEAALFMPEEFGFDEFAGNRAAVDRGKGLARTDAFVVDRAGDQFLARARRAAEHHRSVRARHAADHLAQPAGCRARPDDQRFERSEEHTSELQSLMRISYAVFCLKKKKIRNNTTTYAESER